MNPTHRKPPTAPAAAPGQGVSVDTSDSRHGGDDLALPHERDQGATPVTGPVDPVIAQAHKDLTAGQVDTDMHATPGLDAERRKRLVPRQG